MYDEALLDVNMALDIDPNDSFAQSLKSKSEFAKNGENY